MTDTPFRDLSEHNSIEVDLILRKTNERVVLFRSNDGTYQDHKFTVNLALAKHACDAGQLDCFGVYLVFEDNWRQTFETFKRMVGKPHAKMFIVIDLESWGGRISGDHSAEVAALRHEIIVWLRSFRSPLARVLDRVLGRQRKRVLLYGNAGDLNSLAPKRGDIRIILADYSGNPHFPNEIAHQWASDFSADGLPAGDINSADGRSPLEFARQVGCFQLKFRDAMKLLRQHGLKPPRSSK